MGFTVSLRAKNRLLDYLDKFYLGWFSPAHFDQKVQQYYIQYHEDSFLFVFQSIRSEISVWALLVTPAFQEDELLWKFSANVKNTFEKESLLRAAIFAFRTRQSPNFDDLSEEFQAEVRQAINNLQTVVAAEKLKLDQLKYFNPSESSSDVEIETLQVDLNTEKPAPAFFVDQLLELELSNHKNTSNAHKLPAQFAILIQKTKSQHSGFDSLRLSPVILPSRDRNQITPLPFSINQWNRFEVENIPPLLKSLLQQILVDQDEKHSLRVQKEQFSHLLQSALLDHILEHHTPIFFKENNSYRSVNKVTVEHALISFSPSENGIDLRPQLELHTHQNIPFKMTQPLLGFHHRESGTILFLNDSMQSCYLLQLPKEDNWTSFGLFVSGTPWFPANSLAIVVDRLKNLRVQNLIIETKVKPRHRVKVQPVPILRYFDSEDGTVFFNLDYDYDLAFKSFLNSTTLSGEIKLKTNPDFEKKCREFVFNYLPLQTLQKPYRKAGYYFNFKISREQFESWILQGADDLLNRGYQIFNLRLAKSHTVSKTARIQVESHQQGQWLKLQLQLKGQKNSVLSDLDVSRGFIQDCKGNLYKIHPEDLQQIRKLLILGESPSEWQVPLENPQILVNLLSESFLGDKTLQIIRQTQTKFDYLQQFKAIHIDRQQANQLRPYQLDGVYWLSQLYRANLNGCLADEMGLGKTCQSLVFLDWCKKFNNRSLNLIVAPVSALSNWMNEVSRFAPSLKIHLYYGNQRHYQRTAIFENDIILTSYATLLSDEQWMRKQKFDCLIIDESQTIKNSATKTAQALKKIKSRFRLALSGTPLENSSLELHSLIDFLHPGYLGTKTWFRRRFFKPVERGKVQQTRELLRQLVKPMILRRTKDEVALELPPKLESMIRLKMNQDQQQAYRETARFYHKRISSQIKDTGFDRSGLYVLEGMLRLRQVCLEPQLANPDFDTISSVKLDYLQEVLPELYNQKKRVLIFSQFTAMLDRVSWMLDGLKLNYERLEGHHDLKQRRRAIEAFQNSSQLFLISLKAGGTALNLTAADYVILLDPWWNPAAEAQAIDRAHRIGQTKPVMVYRLICENTIEEKIINLQEHKRELFDSLIGNQQGPLQQLSMQEIMDLFDN